jgi:hypothetical protein
MFGIVALRWDARRGTGASPFTSQAPSSQHAEAPVYVPPTPAGAEPPPIPSATSTTSAPAAVSAPFPGRGSSDARTTGQACASHSRHSVDVLMPVEGEGPEEEGEGGENAIVGATQSLDTGQDRIFLGARVRKSMRVGQHGAR